jgi:hypothetical protein
MSEEELKRVEDEPQWDTIEEIIDYFNQGITAAMVTLARIMWEAGRAGDILQDKSKYGDSAIEDFATGINKGTSWVYECIKMYKAYTWEDIQEKFLKAGISASSIARLGSINDEGTRNYVEDKLVSGEITYEDITKAKKEYEAVANNVGENSAAYDINEQSISETHTIDQLGPEDPSSMASNKIRRECSKAGGVIEKCRTELDGIYSIFRNEIDNVADASLYEISEDRFCDTVALALTLRPLIDTLEDNARKMRPDRFPEDSQ